MTVIICTFQECKIQTVNKLVCSLPITTNEFFQSYIISEIISVKKYDIGPPPLNSQNEKTASQNRIIMATNFVGGKKKYYVGRICQFLQHLTLKANLNGCLTPVQKKNVNCKCGNYYLIRRENGTNIRFDCIFSVIYGCLLRDCIRSFVCQTLSKTESEV